MQNSLYKDIFSKKKKKGKRQQILPQILHNAECTDAVSLLLEDLSLLQSKTFYVTAEKNP